MSLAAGNTIAASDFNTLKSTIYTECARRQMTNPISYSQIADLSAGSSLSATQFANVATPLAVLDIFTTKGLDTQYYTTATQSGQSEATVTVKNAQGLSAKSIAALSTIVNEAKTVAAANNTDCRNNCAGLCTGCQGTCSGTCTSCTGCSGTCTSCTGCSGSCTGTCNTSCTGGCKGSCSGCSGSCSGCSGGCSGSCSSGCSGGCWSYGCGGWCAGSCHGSG